MNVVYRRVKPLKPHSDTHIPERLGTRFYAVTGVRQVGLEPTLQRNLILSQARLPIPPLGRITRLRVTPLEF